MPAEIRRELGLADGDPVMMRVVDGELRVRPMRDALARVRTLLRAYLPEGTDLVGELIADRRAAAADE